MFWLGVVAGAVGTILVLLVSLGVAVLVGSAFSGGR